MQDYIKSLAAICATPCGWNSATTLQPSLQSHFLSFAATCVAPCGSLPSFHFVATCAAFFPFTASCAALTPQLEHSSFVLKLRIT
ncbi:hypothetical protein SLEP1_g59071 [Rubroshorea leprosula]|uniref:Uncharacterized protein n=1 Tax=Rubroshorea leprosula TaxID=152421 RepID=A0AAV5MRD1_9ROSI|nr:hypothetical protein SLEP1_g59071 [Rubroshorea leprosula]